MHARRAEPRSRMMPDQSAKIDALRNLNVIAGAARDCEGNDPRCNCKSIYDQNGPGDVTPDFPAFQSNVHSIGRVKSEGDAPGYRQEVIMDELGHLLCDETPCHAVA